MNVHLLVGSHGSFRCVGKNENARVGLNQTKRLSAILKLPAHRKLLTLEIRGLHKGSRRGTAVSAVCVTIEISHLRGTSTCLG
jgi:hypothetical protein